MTRLLADVMEIVSCQAYPKNGKKRRLFFKNLS